MIRRVQGWLPVRVLQAFGASQAANYASALAFNALLSMFPLILGILAIIGFSIRDHSLILYGHCQRPDCPHRKANRS